MNILALDVASTTGWALSTTVYGTWDLKTRKDESMGMKLIRMEAKLKEIHETCDINLIVYERPAGRHTNSIIHQSKLIAIIETFCEQNGIQYSAYSPSEIKAFATGKGNAGKPAVIEAAKIEFDYPGNDDNEADAIWMWVLAERDFNLKNYR